MSKQPIDLSAYRARRAASEGGATNAVCGPGEVPCAQCRRPLSERASRCLHCGLHYKGFAGDFAPRPPKSRLFKIVAVLLIVLTLVSGIGLLPWGA